MITFCLMSCGEKTEKKCLKAIEHFKEKIVFQEVRNVYPQLKALNQMIEQCNTEYLVPLDADIILDKDAYERIEKGISKFKDDMKWHSILFPLFDTLTQQRILALKVMRADVLKKYPFIESRTPDVEHYQRLKDAGYTAITHYLSSRVIGKHVVKGKWFCYNKYKDVYLTLRSHKTEWDQGVFKGGRDILEKAKNHFNYFLLRWIETGNDDYLYCIAGMTEGLINPVDNQSKDLKRGKMMIPKKDAIHWFFDWFVKNASGLEMI